MSRAAAKSSGCCAIAPPTVSGTIGGGSGRGGTHAPTEEEERMRLLLSAVLALGIVAAAVPAAQPTSAAAHAASAELTATESVFVRDMRRALASPYATVAAAERAGYFRYTPEDETGAISYANLHWTSRFPGGPSQLWYDVHGRLLGADYSLPATSDATPPKRFGLQAGRWTFIPRHGHYVLRAADGTARYGEFDPETFTKAGGNLANPKPVTLVRMGVASSMREVRHLFIVPQTWDAVVWIVPNRNGAFASANPSVSPSAGAHTHGM